jgi:hypothetical protein
MELDRIDAGTQVGASKRHLDERLPRCSPRFRARVNVSESRSAIHQLPAQWRVAADRLRHYAAAGHAQLLEICADELDAALRARGAELLNLEQAAAASGFSADHLGREVRAGRIPNYGRPRAPRVRRADLPRKPGWLRPEEPDTTFIGARGRIARAVADSLLGD